MRIIQTLGACSLVFLGGCFGAEALQQVSSGYVGCPADEVEITNDTAGFNQRSWDASCRGRTYHCSGVAKAGLSCVEDRGPSSAGAAAPPAERDAQRREVSVLKHRWQRFAAKDCGVSVDLPGTPEERRPTVRANDSKVVAYAATVDVDDGAVAVGCQSRPKGATDENHLLDSVRDGALAEIGATFVSEFDVELAGFNGRETQFVVGDQHGRMRVLLRNGKIVTMVLVPTGAFSKQEAGRFFDSLGESPGQMSGSVAAASAP
jgi:hypothetical protein